jgi:hypothetical protein
MYRCPSAASPFSASAAAALDYRSSEEARDRRRQRVPRYEERKIKRQPVVYRPA